MVDQKARFPLHSCPVSQFIEEIKWVFRLSTVRMVEHEIKVKAIWEKINGLFNAYIDFVCFADNAAAA